MIYIPFNFFQLESFFQLFLAEVELLDEETRIEADCQDCPVCLQTCSYPVRLKCGHIFCFLCIKGVVFRSKRCALCRQDVDLAYFENPVVVEFSQKTQTEEVVEEPTDADGRYQWYYEGRNGWWQYEESSSAELEKAHKDGKRSCELLIAGFLYFVDFENMVQFRKMEPGRRRRIKRDVVDAEKKGVAGLRLQSTGGERLHVASVAENTTSGANVEHAGSRTVQRQRTGVGNVTEAVDRLVIGSSSDNESSTPPTNNNSG